MPFENALNVAQILVSVVLIFVILLQAKGSGFGAGLGGTTSAFRTRRGLEKTLFQATIVLMALFLAMSAWSVARIPGRWTLTATGSPLCSTARWTCPIEAAANEACSNDWNTTSGSSPSSARTIWRTSA